MQNHEIAQEGEGPEADVGDPVDPRGQAMRDAMWKGHGGFEIALTPAIFGIAGWTLDQNLGFTPFLTIILASVGLFGSIANQYYRYKHSMEIATAERMEKHYREAGGSRAGDGGPAPSFGPVEYEEVDMSINFGTDTPGAAS